MLRKTAVRLLSVAFLLVSAVGIRAQPPPPPPTLRIPPLTLRLQRQILQRDGLTSGDVTGYVRTEMRRIDQDTQRSYVLLSPAAQGLMRRRLILENGVIREINPNAKTGGKNPPANVSAAGLLVVLTPGNGDPSGQMSFWTDFMKQVGRGRYYIALAIAPRWSSAQPAPWLTEANFKQVKDARFSTETFAADIARDVSASFNIDPQRTFLHGAGESGLATYACSLAAATPFKGFFIHDSAFRSGQLPTLTRAKSRRYYLQQSSNDKDTPLWMADVARKMLADKGATVKLATYQGTGAYNFTENRWERLGEALVWMEGEQQAAATIKAKN